MPVRAAMPISGLFDLPPLVPTSLNKALGLTLEEARRLSPLEWPPPEAGTSSPLWAEPRAGNSCASPRPSSSAGARAGVATRYHEVPGAHHFDVIAGLADPADPLVDFVVELAAKA